MKIPVIPLHLAALCLDCNMIWQIAALGDRERSSQCPACGSGQFQLLAVWFLNRQAAHVDIE